MISNDAGLRWFASERSVHYEHGVVHFREIDTNRSVSLGGNFIVTDLSREEFDEYAKQDENFRRLTELIDSDDDQCDECD